MRDMRWKHPLLIPKSRDATKVATRQKGAAPIKNQFRRHIHISTTIAIKQQNIRVPRSDDIDYDCR